MNKKRQILLSAVLASALAANAQVTINVDALTQVSRYLLTSMVSSSRISTMLQMAVSMPNSSATVLSKTMTRIFLPGKLPLRKVQKSMHNSSIRVCSTMHRARLSSLPSLPSLQLQPLSSMRVSGNQRRAGQNSTNSLSGRKVATRAD